MTNQKTSNFALSQELETAQEKIDEFLVEKENLQNQIERTAYAHAEEKIKLESTLAQQTKLIDFLNAKVVESAPKGKKGKVIRIFLTQHVQKDDFIHKSCREGVSVGIFLKGWFSLNRGYTNYLFFSLIRWYNVIIVFYPHLCPIPALFVFSGMWQIRS